MQALKIAIRTFCIIPFGTGIGDMFNGAGLLTFAGTRLENVANDAVLSSQISFWGAIWFGFGVILWRASSHLRDERDLFRLLCGIIVLSGLARVGSAIMRGFPGPLLTGAMLVELVVGVGFLLWHTSTAQRSNLNTRPQQDSVQRLPPLPRSRERQW